VFVENTASRALLRALGFREVGVYEKHAQLDGAWRRHRRAALASQHALRMKRPSHADFHLLLAYRTVASFWADVRLLL